MTKERLIFLSEYLHINFLLWLNRAFLSDVALENGVHSEHLTCNKNMADICQAGGKVSENGSEHPNTKKKSQ